MSDDDSFWSDYPIDRHQLSSQLASAPPRPVRHFCHAASCRREVPQRMFMCSKHWYMLPKAMRDRVWALYTPGQEIRKNPTREYLEHAQACIDHVAHREGLRS